MEYARDNVRWRLGLGAAGLALSAWTTGAAGQGDRRLGDQDGGTRIDQDGGGLIVPRPQPEEEPQRPPARGGALAQPGDLITFSAFSEGMDLVELVDFVASTLGLQVTIDSSLSGEVMFNAEFSVTREELLPLLNSILSQHGFTITRESSGWYLVVPSSAITPSVVGELATTRFIRTPNLRPSALKTHIEPQFGIASGNQSNDLRLSYLDDLGLIIVTATPARMDAVASLIERLVQERSALSWVRFDLDHLAASVALEEVSRLIRGQASAQPGQPQQNPGLEQATEVTNLADRLRADPQGNALIFHGREDEVALVGDYLAVIDRPSTLPPKRYFTGSATRDIAEFAQQKGLGSVTTFGASLGQGEQANLNRGIRQAPNDPTLLSQAQSSRGGPQMVIDEFRGFIIYYGTPSQHEEMARLVDLFDAPSEEIVVKVYRVRYAAASRLADLLMALIQERSLSSGDEGSLLPQNQPGSPGSPGSQNRTPTNFQRPDTQGGEDAVFSGDSSMIFVSADEDTNQLIVKAPVKQQVEIVKLLDRLDVRRPQVYLDIKIVAISNSDVYRLAVETQLINAMGTGGLGQTNFGLTSPAASGSILDPRLVGAALPGLTTAVILSDYVPFVLTAIQTDTDGRILSNPVLLVDDNQEANLRNVRDEPFQTSTISGGGNQTFSVETLSAGTTVRVTPRANAGGSISLDYEITFQNFAGQGTANLPPPREDRAVSAESVTLPADSTIVVGGITITDIRNTVVKVPIIGNLPIFGHLFRDTNKTATDSVLYFFITPRMLKDANFQGHRLITEGPAKIVDLDPDAPPLRASFIPILEAGGPPAISIDGPVPDEVGGAGGG
ncbi:MAG: hypothetical protein H6811_07655 [Phycisphaeraceae bacterium]|nr:hypothetical protein [Phycisphaeraceae bacterium]